MRVKFWHYSGEKNRLNKFGVYLSGETVLTGNARESIDKMSGELLIEHSGAFNYYNYCYIEDFGRYYYITSDTIERNNIHRLSLETDVLMSHSSGIVSCSGVVARNENLFNTFIIDDQLRFLGYKSINTVNFPYSVKNGETFILTVNGG